MVVVSDEAALKEQLRSGELFRISGDNPVLIDGFLNRATEVDVDAICDSDNDVFIAGIMEHIEEAGVHSGDSACSLPRIPETDIIAEIERRPRPWHRAECARLMNVQYAIQGNEIYVLEVNPRASRTVPSSPSDWLAGAAIASRVMAGEKLKSFHLKPPHPDHISVKEAVLPSRASPAWTRYWTGDALYRRSDGVDTLRARFCQEQIGPVRGCPVRHRVLLGQGWRQGSGGRAGTAVGGAGLLADRHRGTARVWKRRG